MQLNVPVSDWETVNGCAYGADEVMPIIDAGRGGEWAHQSMRGGPGETAMIVASGGDNARLDRRRPRRD